MMIDVVLASVAWASGVGALLVGVAALLTAVGGLAVGLLNRRSVDKVHSLVNAQLSEQTSRADQKELWGALLEAVLRSHGIEPPDRGGP